MGATKIRGAFVSGRWGKRRTPTMVPMHPPALNRNPLMYQLCSLIHTNYALLYAPTMYTILCTNHTLLYASTVLSYMYQPCSALHTNCAFSYALTVPCYQYLGMNRWRLCLRSIVAARSRARDSCSRVPATRPQIRKLKLGF